MGFLKTILYIIVFYSVLLFIGCSSSFIKTEPSPDNDPYTMFGKIPERSFYYPFAIGDSLKKKWSSTINGSFPNSSVTIYDKYVFVNDLSGRIYCFDANNGKKVGQLKNNGAVFSAPLVDRHLVIYISAFNDDDFSNLYYYDLSESEYLHEIKIPGRAMTEMIKSPDGIIFTTDNGIVYKFSLRGEKIWETDTKEITYSSPAMKNNSIVFGNNNGELISLNAKDGSIQYRIKISGFFFGGCSVSGSDIYVGNDNGSLYCVNLSTGKINWQVNTGARITMTPAYDDDNVYIGNLKGDLFSISKHGGIINWQKKAGSLFDITPLVSKNYLIIPDQFEKTYFIDKVSGRIKKTYSFENRLKLSPVIKNNNILFLGYDNGVLEAYEIFN
jgi:eukaryotic-like serine/threonine-protein kinase